MAATKLPISHANISGVVYEKIYTLSAVLMQLQRSKASHESQAQGHP